MSDLVAIAGSAVAAYQRALGTVSNNIANVDSTGYTRQDTGMVENRPQEFGTSFMGTGSSVTGVKRLYDNFIESSLRNATTELSTQEPMVSYANRVVDIVGNQDVGMLSAFDQFFDAARQLATDASSVTLRDQFLSKSDSLAQRFQTVNSQLGLIDQETRDNINSQVSKLNGLADQLSAVNVQLSKTKILDRQPPALMDQRDQLLRDMSALAKIRVTESSNGQVAVSIGASANQGFLVTVDGANPLTAVFNDSSVGKTDLVLNASSPNPEPLTGFSGGSISGLLNFRSQLLQPVLDDLDNLARTLVTEANTIHRQGVDLLGRDGLDLFKIDPQFSVSDPLGSSKTNVSAALTDLSRFSNSTLRLDYSANAGQLNILALSGSYKVGDQINVSFNGATRSFALTGRDQTGASLPAGSALNVNDVQTQLRQFLDGGNGASLDGAFGRQIKVTNGVGNQLVVSSDILASYSLEVSTTSKDGMVAGSVERGQWTVTDTATGEVAQGTSSATLNGITIDFSGSPRDGETLYLRIKNSSAAGIQLAQTDPGRVAAASRFRVIESQFNPGKANADLTEAPESYPKDAAIALNLVKGEDGKILQNSDIPDNGIAFNRVPATPLTVVPAGYRDVVLYLDEVGVNPTDLQVLTRDGRHLAGREMADALISAQQAALGRTLTEDEKAALIDQAGETLLASAKRAGVDFAQGSSYSAQYLNGTGKETYRGMDVFYGVKASVQSIPQLNEDHVVGSVKTLPASVTTFALPQATLTAGATGTTQLFKDGELILNGKPLPALSVSPGDDVATKIRDWLRGVSSNTTVNVNTLASGGKTLTLTQKIATESDAKPEDSEIRLSLGASGTSTSLAKLGLRTGVYLKGEVKEDLYVFATSTNSAAHFKLNATYTQGSRDPVQSLRAEPFNVVFTAPDRFQIIDKTTGSVVADRSYDAAQGILYRGVKLTLDIPPVAGDEFTVDGDQDGVGNNGNAIRLSALQSKRVVGASDGTGLTLSEAYSKSVSDAGNVSFQAGIAQKALTVVKDQAVQARDQVSGVSLDQEAADLIRYQQAYQASAKVMQTASTLFDSILGIR
ncbi:MAG: flagellar hook-associated protein FlgK [Betaproteobacteria bacterium]|nr:flagellar hook-associated protein FlgK [Betaproteobacteria bacterium]NBY14441.1 flagellar hook-associated protein FlgK [Betaproteobacteria bacterium]